MSTYETKLNRIKAAIALEPVDKIPFVSGGPAAMAAYAGVPLKDYLNDMELNCTTNLAFDKEFQVDATQAPIFSPMILMMQWLSKVELPGDGVVADNDLWQIHETERMMPEDYDKILEMGFGAWSEEFLKTQYGDVMNKIFPFFHYSPIALQRYTEAGIPNLCDSVFESPFECVCGARSLEPFVMDDLFDIPEKVEEVFAVIHKENMDRYEKICSNPNGKPTGVWIGGWRGTPSMLSPDMFEKFSWNYMKQYIDLCIQYDVIPLCHLDSNWDLGLKYFRELPAKKMILALDGQTDIFKAKSVLGDHSCLMGDVPASMLAFGTAEDTKNYCRKLVKEVGPTGFIMSSGCDTPFNVNFDNFKQMNQAIEDYQKGLY